MNLEIATDSNTSVVDSVLPPPWSVIEFTFSNQDTDVEIVAMCNYVRFVVQATENGFASSPQLREKYIFFLNMAKNYEVPDFNEDDFFDWALEPLLPVLCEQTPWELKGKTATLNNALYAPIMEYTLEAVSDKLVLRPREEHAETQSMFGVSRPDGYQQWPGYLPSETLLDKNASYDSIPRKVILPDGSRGFFKIVGRGEKHTIETELNNYDRIRISQLPSSVRISRLLGLVRDECDTVFGLLLTYIDCGTVTLTCAVESGASDCQRQEWVAEVTQIISSLHKNGIVWGDAKPDNILIDQNQNAWIIYFGGGYSEAWVPKDLAGTMNGDLVALAKVVDYINGDLPFQSEKGISTRCKFL